MEQDQSYAMNLIKNERDQKVVRSVNLIQRAQYTLSLEEQRFMLYCISKVKPEDKEGQKYTIRLRDYMDVCGISKDTSYDNMKRNIIGTLQKMLLAFEYKDDRGKTNFLVTNWFDHIILKKEDGMVEFQFSSIVAPELIGLAQYNQKADNANKLYYIADELKYMLPFHCRYSYYLYPLLRSYQNRNEWTFSIEELRERLDVYERLRDDKDYRSLWESDSKKRVDKRRPLYARFPDFRRGVLDPAVEDINRYSNIKVAYRVERKGRNPVAVTFIFEEKSPREKIQSEMRGSLILDRTDDYTVMVASNVPDPEDPLRFTETQHTGSDTQPQSITVPKQNSKPIKTAAQAKEHLHEMNRILAEEQSRKKKPTDYGKRINHTTRKRTNPYLDTDSYFPIENFGKTQFALKTSLSLVNQYAALVGGAFQRWAKDAAADEVRDFIEFCVKTRGSARLKKYDEEGRLTFSSPADTIIVEMNGLTIQGDFSRLLHKVFNEKRTASEAYADWEQARNLPHLQE